MNVVFFPSFFIKWGSKFCFFIDRVLDVLFMSTSHQVLESFSFASPYCRFVKCWPSFSVFSVTVEPTSHINRAHEKSVFVTLFTKHLWRMMYYFWVCKRNASAIKFNLLSFPFLYVFISPNPRTKKSNQSVWLNFLLMWTRIRLDWRYWISWRINTHNKVMTGFRI